MVMQPIGTMASWDGSESVRPQVGRIPPTKSRDDKNPGFARLFFFFCVPENSLFILLCQANPPGSRKSCDFALSLQRQCISRVTDSHDTVPVSNSRRHFSRGK